MIGKKNNDMRKRSIDVIDDKTAESSDTEQVTDYPHTPAMVKAMDIARSFNAGSARFDPLGAWTGVPENGNEEPTQDADDL